MSCHLCRVAQLGPVEVWAGISGSLNFSGLQFALVVEVFFIAMGSFMRLGIQGTRTLILAPTPQLLEHLTTIGGGTPVALAAVNHWIKTATVESAKAFVDASKGQAELFTCTVGPGDLLSLPAGYVFYEKIQAATDFVGVRQPILAMSGLKALSEISRHLIRIESPSMPLQRAVDCLALAE